MTEPNEIIRFAQQCIHDPSISDAAKADACAKAYPFLRTSNAQFLYAYSVVIATRDGGGVSGRHGKESISLLRQAISIDSSDAMYWAELGNAYSQLGENDEAWKCFGQAYAIDPNQPTNRWNRALHLLRAGDYRQGWREYTFGQVIGTRPVRFPLNQWDGKPIGNNTLYLWAEQGLGDTIQFVRYVQAARAAAGPDATIIVEIQGDLISLFPEIPGADRVVIRNNTGSFQSGGALNPYHASLMDLPMILGIRPEEYADGDYPAAFAERAPRTSDKLRVGFVWAGSKGHKADFLRSMPDATAQTLLRGMVELRGEVSRCDCMEVVSLQYGYVPDPGDLPMERPALTTFAETMEVIKTLDVVVGVDTGVCHLAGAMGVPTILMLSKANDWRWGIDRTDSIWYANHRLVRQETLHDWAQVNRDVLAILGDLAT